MMLSPYKFKIFHSSPPHLICSCCVTSRNCAQSLFNPTCCTFSLLSDFQATVSEPLKGKGAGETSRDKEALMWLWLEDFMLSKRH